MNLALTHYSKTPIKTIHSVKQPIGPTFKPLGLWVSIDENEEGWADWCKREGFQLECLEYVHDIKLIDGAKILHIKDAFELDAFAERFSACPDCFNEFKYQYYYVRWDKVSAEFQGIIIAPYIWSRRLDGGEKTRWYYSWDCASGCIWGAEAIASVTLRQKVEA